MARFDLYNSWYDKKYGYDLFDRIHRKFNSQIVEDDGDVTPDNIVSMIKGYSQASLDFHLTVGGQNGTGKSWTGLAVAKYIQEKAFKKKFDLEDNVIYAFNTVQELIEKISTKEKEVIALDESNMFLSYKNNASKSNQALITIMEICRENQNCLVNMVRDVRKLDNNYRNGKVNLLLLLIDRQVGEGPEGYDPSDDSQFNPDIYRPYGAMLQGNFFFEDEDKFKLDTLPSTSSQSELKEALQELDTFRGVFPGFNYLTPEEITLYRTLKKKQIFHAKDILLSRLNKKTKETEKENIVANNEKLFL